nr:thioester domain-containing protein [uncultured Carboxylicivirga sp.]
MRKILSVFAIGALLIFSACEKDHVEAPGDIPGMGNASGELTYDEAFSLPEGIELVGTMTGIDESSSVAIGDDMSLKSTFANQSVQTFGNYGSGGRFIKLLCNLKNTTNQYRTVFFPRGLLCKVHKEGYQNAMSLQWTWVTIKPYGSRTFILHMYCINYGRSGSDAQSEFSFLGITNSPTMWNLINRIGWRKINYEHYFGHGYPTSYSLKDEAVSYENITSELQNAVWSVTNGDGLTDESISFIESIPELEEGTYPDNLDDIDIQPPFYFDEYTPAE